MAFAKGTQPTFSLTFPETVDLTATTEIHVTFKSGQTKLDKTGEDLTVTAHQIDVSFSQEESLAFAVGMIEVQANWLMNGKRQASEISAYEVGRQLLNEVIGNDNDSDDLIG